MPTAPFWSRASLGHHVLRIFRLHRLGYIGVSVVKSNEKTATISSQQRTDVASVSAGTVWNRLCRSLLFTTLSVKVGRSPVPTRRYAIARIAPFMARKNDVERSWQNKRVRPLRFSNKWILWNQPPGRRLGPTPALPFSDYLE
jgi:hypothetical protein